MLNRGFVPIHVVMGLVFIMGIISIFYYSTKTSDSNTLPTTQSNPEASPTPIMTPQSSSKSDNTQEKLTKIKTIFYNLPDGWQTIKDKSATFEVGYDPKTYKPDNSQDNMITLGGIPFGGPDVFTMRYDYDGGSRHTYLDSILKDTAGNWKYDKTYEKDYRIDGRSALVFYNVDMSATTVYGVVIVDNNRAITFSSTYNDEDSAERLLSTIRVLK